MIVAGFGFRDGATASSLQDALSKFGRVAVARVATAEAKARHPAFTGLQAACNLPAVAVPASDLRTQVTQTDSAASAQAHGTGSVAEAAALAAAGPGARLLGPRRVSNDHMATCALAEGKDA